MALEHYLVPEDPIELIHYDDHFVVVNKKAGFLSVPGRLEHLQDSVQTRIGNKYGYCEAAHRLDMATSGLILLSLSKKADAHFKQQFRTRVPKKEYLALVNGIVKEDHFIIDLPLACDWLLRPRQQVDFVRGKASQTRCRVITRYPQDNSTLVSLEPITGRSHQLRVHLASLGHPIRGDKFYSHLELRNLAPSLCLHAHQLSFKHPINEEWLHFKSAPQFSLPNSNIVI